MSVYVWCVRCMSGMDSVGRGYDEMYVCVYDVIHT